MTTQLPLAKLQLSIGLIWLFHLSGIIGIIYSDSEWFIRATPLNLLLSFSLLLVNTKLNLKTSFLVLLCFMVGMGAEILGVQYGWFFGQYSYGAVLGIKFLGVPLLIGINWCVLVFITGQIAAFFTTNFWFKSLLGVGLMVFLDLVMEPIAPQLDFWTFEGGVAPIQNYLGWAFVAMPLQMIFHKTRPAVKTIFAFHLYILQFLFFTLLLMRLNSL
jgi:putative membrane protein